MRTTLDIDDDVLSAARELARGEGKTIGEIISDLARKALTTPAHAGFAEAGQDAHSEWPTFPDREGPIVTPEMIRQIQEDIDLEDAMPFDHATGEVILPVDTGPPTPKTRRRKPAK